MSRLKVTVYESVTTKFTIPKPEGWDAWESEDQDDYLERVIVDEIAPQSDLEVAVTDRDIYVKQAEGE